jgi:hypothetical protein
LHAHWRLTTFKVNSAMSPLQSALLAGLVFGALSVALMVPMRFPDKTAALCAAFAERFAIGLVAGLVHLPLPGWLGGALLGLLMSVSSAIVTKAWKPILIVGTAGGLLIGGLLHGWN